ncbi:MAG: hypothetical protein EAZ64_02540 [Sphingobacteriales bacterium]|nr:MAG: hypothetical protein EAZ64_02540 [Sphingobacteriales bacterium]
MDNVLNISKPISQITYNYQFTICTLVTSKPEYEEMLQTFLAKGFDTQTCEYLYIDNCAQCTFDAYKGLNQFLQQAKGKYIIICHQDIVLHNHSCFDLLNRINEIEDLDPQWAILSNAGGINLKHVAMHVTQKNGNRLLEKYLPLKAQTVDENFILVKNEANLSLSNNLYGFHMYGTDICLIADICGYNAYIIDFNLTHKSDGNADSSFYALRKKIKLKYKYALRGRFMSTTITRFYISGNCIGFWLCNTGIILFLVRQYYKVFKNKPQYILKKRFNH